MTKILELPQKTIKTVSQDDAGYSKSTMNFSQKELLKVVESAYTAVKNIVKQLELQEL